MDSPNVLFNESLKQSTKKKEKKKPAIITWRYGFGSSSCLFAHQDPFSLCNLPWDGAKSKFDLSHEEATIPPPETLSGSSIPTEFPRHSLSKTH